MSEEKSSPVGMIVGVAVVAAVIIVGCVAMQDAGNEQEANKATETNKPTEPSDLVKSTKIPNSVESKRFEEYIRKSLKKPNGELTQEDFDKIKSIYFRHSTLDDISIVSKMRNLESFDIADAEKVSDLSPLKGHTKLKRLLVQENSISDISVLTNLTELEEVHLGRNPIEDISPLLGLKKLKVIDIRTTKVSLQNVEKLMKALPNCKITHNAK
jgi:Leucine-rich repeat (LRR) protein